MRVDARGCAWMRVDARGRVIVWAIESVEIVMYEYCTRHGPSWIGTADLPRVCVCACERVSVCACSVCRFTSNGTVLRRFRESISVHRIERCWAS
jgi:hypothetical protein